MPALDMIKGGIAGRSVIENSRAHGSAAYAIIFNLDAPTLETTYPTPIWTDAYKDIARFLRSEGFDRQQGSVYFGNDDVRSKDCIKVVMDLDAMFPWFKPSVRDIRMMQITEEDTLMDFLGFEPGISRRRS